MSKKSEKSSERLLKMLDEEEQGVKNEVSQFYIDGVIADMSGPNTIGNVIATVRKALPSQSFHEDEMQEKCLRIREAVKQCKDNSIEINLKQGVHRYKGDKLELGKTVIKAVVFGTEEPIFYYFKQGDSFGAIVFLGGDDGQAFLATKQDDGKDSFTRLSEFHLLSINDNSDPEKEVGLVTSYIWRTAKVYSSVIMGFLNLDPIKNILLAEEIERASYEAEKIKSREENE